MNRLIPIAITVLLLSASLAAQRTKHVVIVVIDGARYSETFDDSGHANIPALWNELRPQGTIYTRYYNGGKTETNPGHSSILSGVWQYILNEGSQRPYSPTLFEYLRKQKGLPANRCWVALGKAKLNILSHSTHAEYGEPYGASVLTSGLPADDIITWQNVRTALHTHRSFLTIANFGGTDIEGHAANWEGYIGNIRRADTLIASLWRGIQADTVLANKTTLIVTNDHGRHTTDFVSHGDGCDGCRHIMLMVLGPDTPKGLVDSTICSQIDIAPTVAAMMRFAAPLAQGSLIASAVSAAKNVPLSFTAHPAGAVAGTVPLSWSLGLSGDPLTTLVEYSRTAGRTWDTLAVLPGTDSTYQWNTSLLPDGTRYRLRVQVFGDTSYGAAMSAGDFTVNNPGNGAPDVTFLSPDRNLTLSGGQTVLWSAADPEGDPLTVAVHGSSDGGTTWQTIAEGVPNTGSYAWNTLQSANSTTFMLRVRCSDGIAVSDGTSPVFELSNQRQHVNLIRQVAGTGSGRVSAHVVDPSQLTGDTYRVTFTVIDPVTKRFTVTRLPSNVTLLNQVPFSGDGGEGPVFDGVRLAILDYPEPTHDPDSTGWVTGSSALSAKVSLPDVYLPDDTVTAQPEPADYEVRVSDTVVDTSMSYLESSPTPMYFTVMNISRNRTVPVVLSELDGNGKLSFGDDLFLFMEDDSGNHRLTWEVFMDGEASTPLPLPGSVYRIATNKPITAADAFEFDAVVTGVAHGAALPGRFELRQNFPNPFNPVTTIEYALPSAGEVTVQVFDLLGREVSVVERGIRSGGVHRCVWDASRSASGVYFVRLTARHVGTARSTLIASRKLLLLK